MSRIGGQLERLGWSQAEFGRRMGVTSTHVGRWVKGDSEMPVYAQTYLDAAMRYADIFDEASEFLMPSDGRRK